MKQKSFVISIMRGGICGAILMLFLSAVCALALVNNLLPPDQLKLVSVVIIVLSVVAGSVIASAKEKNKFLLSLGTGAVIFLLMLLSKLAFFPGEYKTFIQNTAVVFVSSAISALLFKLPKKKRYSIRGARGR